MCLHGGAGTGKSYALKAIYQTLNKILNNKPGQKTNDLTTLLIKRNQMQQLTFWRYQYNCCW